MMSREADPFWVRSDRVRARFGEHHHDDRLCVRVGFEVVDPVLRQVSVVQEGGDDGQIDSPFDEARWHGAFQPDRTQSAETRVVHSVAALISCRVTRVVEDVGGLQSDESAVGAGERVCLSAPVECAAVDRMVERDPLVPPVPIFVAAERAGHARSPASQEVEDGRLRRHRSATVAHPLGRTEGTEQLLRNPCFDHPGLRRTDLGYSARASGRAL